jgi:hypothetical protein
MHDPEIQFPAPGPILLADALRDAVGGEGRKPSRKQVRAWILAGRVRVEGQLVRDPERRLEAGEVVDLGPGAEGSVPARARGPRAEGILHLDRHLLVAAYEPPVVVRPDAGDVAARLEVALEEAAVAGLRPRPVPTPDARASGLVAAALSQAAEDALAEAFAASAAALTVVAEVAAGAGPGPEGLPARTVTPLGGGRLRVRDTAVRAVPAFLAALAEAGCAACPVPGTGPAGLCPLLVHVAGIRLPHPRTGRMLTWELALPPGFAPDPPARSR